MSKEDRFSPETLPILSKKRNADGTVEALLGLDQGTLQIVWEQSYTPQVVNPDNYIEAFITGKDVPLINSQKPKLLFGTNENGRCSFDCVGCTFANSVMKQAYRTESNSQFRLARPVNFNTQYNLIKRAEEIAMQEGILTVDGTYGAGGLLSGDSATNPNLESLMLITAASRRCISSRWSTIAPETPINVFDRYLNAARLVPENHTFSFQVSLHSTDETERHRHTGAYKLISPRVISEKARQLREQTDRKISIAFVIHGGSIISPDILAHTFSPEDVVISLRPIHSETTPGMLPNGFLNLYSKIRSKGFSVVYVPPSISGAELDNIRQDYSNQAQLLRP